MTSFDASASMLGFVHQMRWALYELLLAAKRTRDETLRVSIETFDDVAVHDDDGKALRAVQLKQHGRRAAPLSDGHPDLWKTLRVWLSNSVLADSNGPQLYLLTTAGVSAGSAPSFLTGADRDAGEALRILNENASGLNGQDTAVARKLWVDSDAATKQALLERMTVVINAPSIHDVDDLVGRELLVTMSPKNVDDLLEHLWGWWDSQCIRMLNPDRTEPRFVSASDLLGRIRTLRDEIREDALSINPETDIDAISIENGYDERFIEQLRWVNANAETLRLAIIDYLRAYAHTTRWIQEGELFDPELERYERALKQEWDIAFNDMVNELEMDGTDDENARARAGWNLFRMLRNSTSVIIRTGFPETFHARGARYAIASTGSHGWHPDFEERFAQLLGQVA